MFGSAASQRTRMARPKSDDKRSAILSAATRIIAAQGLGAPTAAIAQEAGVSNGSLFTYFETKADLLNHLYVELKTEMGTAALHELPTASDLRAQVLSMWSLWLRWATSCPDKRRVLAHLDVSGNITVESRRTVHQTMAGIAELLERCRQKGRMRNASLEFVLALMSALADTTADLMIRDPANADQHCQTAFNAMWRMLA